MGVLCLCVNGFGRIIQNGTEIGFSGSGQEVIRKLVIEGAGYYLKSHSDMLLFLNRIEMSDLRGLDFDEARGIVNGAVSQMEKAMETYEKLAMTAETVPYNEEVVQRLLTRDYSPANHSEDQQQGVNGAAFDWTGNILKEGDIRGIYYKMIQNTGRILDMVREIKNHIDNGMVPVTASLWRVSEAYAETLVFGHKVAAVFYELAGK